MVSQLSWLLVANRGITGDQKNSPHGKHEPGDRGFDSFLSNKTEHKSSRSGYDLRFFPSGHKRSSDAAGETGGILIGLSISILVFFMVAAMGVDLSRYFLRMAEVQKVADGAALSGAQALGYYSNQPKQSRAVNAAWRYIRTHQGEDYADLYQYHGAGKVEGIYVEGFTNTKGDSSYKVGVLVHGTFEPYFLPRMVFGDDPIRISRMAVSRIDGTAIQKIDDVAVECGVYADGLMEIDGENIDVSEAGLCGNSDIDAGGGSSNKYVGDVFYHEDATVTCPDDNGCENLVPLDEPHAMPTFQYSDPSYYDIDLRDYSSYSQGVCDTGKELPNTEWDTDLTQVCVNKEDTDNDGNVDEYVFLSKDGKTPNNFGNIQAVGGGAISIYADAGVTFNANNVGLDGGIYASGDIVVDGNNNKFLGDPTKEGGVALWSDETLNINTNSITVRGIMGSRLGGDVVIGSNGGGDGTDIRGMVISNGDFAFHNDSNSAEIVHDPTAFDPDALDLGNWKKVDIAHMKAPQFVNARAYLVE